MLSLLLACIAMACRDAIGTWTTIAVSRGRGVTAGALDAMGDLASIGVAVLGAGPVIKHGITPHAIVVIGCMLVVSFFGTILWTRLGQRIGRPPPVVPPIGVTNA